jgi:hypothetical protein
MKKWLLFTIILAALAASGCANSRMQESHKNAQYKGGPIKSVLVLGMAKKHKTREAFEILFSRDLAKAGIKAEPSYKNLPEGTKLDGNVVKAAADKLGMQTVMVVHYRGLERKMQDPKTPHSGPDYSALPYYVPSVYHYVNRSDYSPTKSYLQLECNLYDTASQELIWTGHSEILDPGNLNKLTDDLAGLVVAQLKKDGLLP